MDGVKSFIELKNVFVEYSSGGGFLKTLSGQGSTTHSVLRDISFSLPLGQAVCIFGESGSGKTTLLRLLAGAIKPRRGAVTVNGKPPSRQKLAAGYISSEETEPLKDTVTEILHEFGRSHGVKNLPARIGYVFEVLDMGSMVNKPAARLSTTERLRVNIARAAISDVPVILMDGVADELGVEFTKKTVATLFVGRSVLISTRFTYTAENLDYPILLMHGSELAQFGTCNDIASNVGCNRVVDVWIEGLKYDLLRRLRSHPGVAEVLLLPTDHFAGQKLRITLVSSRYLPAVYDMVSQTDLVKIHEQPPSLADILARL